MISEISDWLATEMENLSQSAVKFALLSIIERHTAAGGIHGYAIGEELIILTKGELDGKKATFYATLRKLEKDELVESAKKPSPVGPPRKHYTLTTKGRRVLNALYENWRYYYSIVKEIHTGSAELLGANEQDDDIE